MEYMKGPQKPFHRFISNKSRFFSNKRITANFHPKGILWLLRNYHGNEQIQIVEIKKCGIGISQLTNMAAGSCEFGANCKITETFRLENCRKDSSSHLTSHQSSCKSFEPVTVPESCLILNRFGIFGLQNSLFSKFICPYHRNVLGLYWKRPSRLCHHPFHKESKAKPDRGLNYVQSHEIWLKLVAVQRKR